MLLIDFAVFVLSFSYCRNMWLIFLMFLLFPKWWALVLLLLVWGLLFVLLYMCLCLYDCNIVVCNFVTQFSISNILVSSYYVSDMFLLDTLKLPIWSIPKVRTQVLKFDVYSLEFRYLIFLLWYVHFPLSLYTVLLFLAGCRNILSLWSPFWRLFYAFLLIDIC